MTKTKPILNCVFVPYPMTKNKPLLNRMLVPYPMTKTTAGLEQRSLYIH
jgi:hypothetical protein